MKMFLLAITIIIYNSEIQQKWLHSYAAFV